MTFMRTYLRKSFCFGDLFLLSGFFSTKTWKYFIPFHVDSCCAWGNNAPIKIERRCLRFREGVFQFAPVPMASPHPGSWSSLALGEVVRKASLSIPTPCGSLCADFVCRFLCVFFVRFFCADFVCVCVCADLSCGFWIMCADFSADFDADFLAGRATKKSFQKSSPKSFPGCLPVSPPFDSKNHRCTPRDLGARCLAQLLSVPLSGNIAQWLTQV